MSIHHRLPILALALLLPACTTAPSTQDASASTSSDADASMDAPSGALAKTLGEYRWRLESATDAQGRRIDALFPAADRALTLSFADDRVGVEGGCNRMGGAYTLDAQGRLRVARMNATMMACAPPLMAADAAISERLAGPLDARIEESAPPRLRLVAASGETLLFAGEATAETRYGGPGQVMFLEIAPQRVACSHPLIPDHRCLSAREVRYGADGVEQGPRGEWRPLYEDIEGYDFTEGTRNVLRVKRFERSDVPADASSTVYVLDMMVESETVAPDDASR